ncbi:MAG TPA: hypothetical protein VLY21_05020 [Nitrososphaerales archaeon]|nr:hypothetical protein [Nitrososphaerales archaeon]
MSALPLGPLSALLISPGTANLLAYLVLVVVAIFLISGPAIVYFYYRKHKKETAVSPTPPSSA